MLFVTLLAASVVAAGTDAGGRVQNVAFRVMRSVRGTPTMFPIGL